MVVPHILGTLDCLPEPAFHGPRPAMHAKCRIAIAAAAKGDAPIVVVAPSAMIPLYVEVARYSATYVADGFGTRPPVIDLDQPPSCASGAGEPGRLRLGRAQ